MDFRILPSMLGENDSELEERFTLTGLGEQFERVRASVSNVLLGKGRHHENFYFQLLPRHWQEILESTRGTDQFNDVFSLSVEVGKILLRCVDLGISMVSIFETCKPKDAKGLKGILDALEVEATKREDSLDRSNERNKPFNPYAGMFEGIGKRRIVKLRKRLGLSDEQDSFDYSIFKYERADVILIECAFLPPFFSEEIQRTSVSRVGETSGEQIERTIALRQIAQAHIVGFIIDIDTSGFVADLSHDAELEELKELSQEMWSQIYQQGPRLSEYKGRIIRSEMGIHLAISQAVTGRSEVLRELYESRAPSSLAMQAIQDSSMELCDHWEKLERYSSQYLHFPSYRAMPIISREAHTTEENPEEDGSNVMTEKIEPKLLHGMEQQSLYSAEAEILQSLSLFSMDLGPHVSGPMKSILRIAAQHYPMRLVPPLPCPEGAPSALQLEYHNGCCDYLLCLYFAAIYHLEKNPDIPDDHRFELEDAIENLALSIDSHIQGLHLADQYCEHRLGREGTRTKWLERINCVRKFDLDEMEKLAHGSNFHDTSDSLIVGILEDYIMTLLRAADEVPDNELFYMQTIFHTTMSRVIRVTNLSPKVAQKAQEIIDRLATI